MTIPTCPKCGSNRFDIDACMIVTAEVEFTDDDGDHDLLDDPHGDVEWDDDAPATCRECGHSAPLDQMVAP